MYNWCKPLSFFLPFPNKKVFPDNVPYDIMGSNKINNLILPLPYDKGNTYTPYSRKNDRNVPYLLLQYMIHQYSSSNSPLSRAYSNNVLFATSKLPKCFRQQIAFLQEHNLCFAVSNTDSAIGSKLSVSTTSAANAFAVG